MCIRDRKKLVNTTRQSLSRTTKREARMRRHPSMSIHQTQNQNELNKKIQKTNQTRLLETRSHSEALHTNSKLFAFSEHDPHLTRRAKQTSQPSRHLLMSQYTLKWLSAIYERRIKVGMKTPHNEATKATQNEQQILRATLCTKLHHTKRHPLMSQTQKKRWELRPLWVDEDRFSTEAHITTTPLTLVRRQAHQKWASAVHHAWLPLREGVVRLSLVVKTRFQDQDKPSQLLLTSSSFEKLIIDSAESS